MAEPWLEQWAVALDDFPVTGSDRSSFLNQPVEVPILRNRLAQTMSSRGFPQMLLRLGYGRAVRRRTPRRAVESLLDP